MNPRSWSPRTRRWLWTVVALLAVFTVTGFFIAPPIVRSQLQKQLSAALGRDVTVGRVSVNPYALSITIEQLDIRRLDRTGTFAGWDRLYVNFDALASLGGDWVLHAVELDRFHLTASIEQDGNFNFADILAKVSAPPPPGTPPPAPSKPRPVRIGSLKVAQARVDFADRSRGRPFATVLGPVSLNLTEFRTVAERGAPFHFAATTEAGERFEWRGTLVADPFRSSGDFMIENLALAKYAAYYADRLTAELADGRLTVRGRYEVNLAPSGRVVRLQDGAVALRALKLLERADGPAAVQLEVFDVAGVNFDVVKLEGSVDWVRAGGGELSVRRERDGSLNLLAMLVPPEGGKANPASASAAAAAAGLPAALPQVSVGEVILEKLAVQVEDLAAPRPAKLGIANLKVAVRDVSLADGAVMPVQVAFDWVPEGRVELNGKVGVRPSVRAELQLDVQRFALLPLSPYLEEHLNARLAEGAVGTTQRVKFTQGGSDLAVELEGGVRVEKLGLVDGDRQESLAGLGSLELNGIKVSTAPQLSVAVDQVALIAPFARVAVREDGSMNLAGLLKTGGVTAPPAAAASSTTAPTASAPRIAIGGVKIEGGEFSFSDRSIAPQVRVALTQFGGTIGALSSENFARAQVDLRGSVDGVGPVTVTGLLDPLGAKRFVDVKVGVRNVDLLPLSPYSGKYAGFELARGKFALDVNAFVDGTQLRSENIMTLSQFTFGAAVESKDATGLPVRLGVALLKDLDGNIVIDVPVEGDLSDPNLRIGRVVVRVIVNLLTKAAASPFKLLGSMFGGGGDELAFHEFDPGAHELRATERAKLETMVKALTNRPGLSLGLEGGYDDPADTFALKRAKLTSLVRSKIWEERRQADPNIAPPEKLEISGEAYAAKLKQLFDEKFPPGTEFGAPLPAAPTVVAAPPPPTGFFKKVVRVLTGAERRAAREVEAENQQRLAEHEAAVAVAKSAGLPVEEMTGRLADTLEVTADDLRALAAARAQRVREFLINEGKIAAERLYLVQPKEAQKENKGPRVFLTLQ